MPRPLTPIPHPGAAQASGSVDLLSAIKEELSEAGVKLPDQTALSRPPHPPTIEEGYGRGCGQSWEEVPWVS